jgi:hypothetical protein
VEGPLELPKGEYKLRHSSWSGDQTRIARKGEESHGREGDERCDGAGKKQRRVREERDT